MNAIAVRDLRKSYGALEAVGGISFEVARGEVFGLLGPNGAGKTTTVEILEGYRKRDAGGSSVLGRDPATADGPGASGSAWSSSPRRCTRRSASRRASRVRRLLPAAAAGGRGGRARRARGQARRPRAHALGRAAPPARPRPRARRRPRADLPRRADDRLRPGRAARRLGDDPRRCAASARRSCSRRTTSTRPSSSPTASPSCARGDRRLGPARRADRSRARDRDPLPRERQRGRPPHRGADARAARADRAGARRGTGARRATGAQADPRGGLPLADRRRPAR